MQWTQRHRGKKSWEPVEQSGQRWVGGLGGGACRQHCCPGPPPPEPEPPGHEAEGSVDQPSCAAQARGSTGLPGGARQPPLPDKGLTAVFPHWLTPHTNVIPPRGHPAAPARLLARVQPSATAPWGSCVVPWTPLPHCAFCCSVTAGLGQVHASSWAQVWPPARACKEVEGCTGKDLESEELGSES